MSEKRPIYMGAVPPSSFFAKNVFMEDMTTVEEHIVQTEQDIVDIDDRIDTVEENITNLNERVEDVEEDVADLDDRTTINEADIIDLQDNKQDKLTAGTNITIDADNVISAAGGGGVLWIEDGVTLYDDVVDAYNNDKLIMAQVGSSYKTIYILSSGMDASGFTMTSILTSSDQSHSSADVKSFYTMGVGKDTDGTVKFANAREKFLALDSTASTTKRGLVKVDGTTITITGQTISAETATASSKGIVQPDGSTITVDGSGVISAVGEECEVFIIRLNETTYGEARQAWNDKKVLVLWEGNAIAFCRNNKATGSPPSSITFSGLFERDNRYEGTNARVESFLIYQISNFSTASDDTVISSYWADTTKIPAINFTFLNDGTYKLQAVKDSNGSKYNWVPDKPILRTVTLSVASTDWTRPSTLSSRWSYTVPTTDFEYDDDHMIIAKITYDNGTNLRLMPHWDTGISSGTDYEADDCFNVIDNVLTLQSQTNTDETVKITYWEV